MSTPGDFDIPKKALLFHHITQQGLFKGDLTTF